MSVKIIVPLTFLALVLSPAPSQSGQESDQAAVTTQAPVSLYRISGNRAVRPMSVQDDGARTEIRWLAAQSIPAVFALSDQGQEEVVNGYMRDDVFVIDRVYARLVFRIDRAEATARRRTGRRR